MGGGFGVSTSFVTALGIGGNRDGVRIVAPHDLQEHDEHKIWTKKNTWHWETGWVWHLTQGQVLHVDANLLSSNCRFSVQTPGISRVIPAIRTGCESHGSKFCTQDSLVTLIPPLNRFPRSARVLLHAIGRAHFPGPVAAASRLPESDQCQADTM